MTFPMAMLVVFLLSLASAPTALAWVGGRLMAVSCPGPRACMAVGDSVGYGGPAVPIAEAWDGLRWGAQMPIAPVGGMSGLAAVSCGSRRNCDAVGNEQTCTTANPPLCVQIPLAEQWDGTNWSVSWIPSPGNAVNATLSGISCTSPGACVRWAP